MKGKPKNVNAYNMELLNKNIIIDGSMPISDIKYLNKMHGVYFLIDKKEVVYVGISEDISYRLNCHTYSKVKKFSHFFFVEFSEYRRLRDMEYLYIRKFKPKFNIQHIKEKKLQGKHFGDKKVKLALKYLGYNDYNKIASKHYFTTPMLMKIMLGEKPYETLDYKKRAMIKEATELIRERVINDMEVIHKTVK